MQNKTETTELSQMNAYFATAKTHTYLKHIV